MFPIRQGDDLVGFIGRRNPTKDHSEYAGPKYLNTRATAAFTKGDQLYGLSEGRPGLDAGATPVLVEGPLDAIAVTLAGRGGYVGVAPLGTAFTTEQAAALNPYFREDSSRILIATDPDLAGWTAAQRAFWRLAALRANPKHVALSEGVDPADLLQLRGSAALRQTLDHSQPFATALLSRLVADGHGDLQSPAARLRLVREAGQMIGALPPAEWTQHIERLTSDLGLPTGMLHIEVVDAGAACTNDPEGQMTARLIALSPRARALANPPASHRGPWLNVKPALADSRRVGPIAQTPVEGLASHVGADTASPIRGRPPAP